jgi:hypothetical protein
VYVHRPVTLLVVVGALLAVPVASQAAVVRSTSGIPAHAGAAPRSRATAAATVPPAGGGTRVSVRVLAAPSTTPTPRPTSTPTHPSTGGQPTTPRGHGGNLPKTGANSLGLLELGLAVVSVGLVMMWLASMAFRRRRESIG